MKNNFVFRWIYNTYLFVFARPYFQKINEVIFRIIIGPLGFMNYSGDFRLTGERRLFQKLSILNFEIVIDIGANKGDWAEMVLKEAPISKVYAFEPQKSEFDKLIKLSKNHPSRLFPYNLALGDAEKDIEIHIHDTSSELSYIDNHLNQLPLLTGKSSISESIKMTLFDTFIESKQDEFKVINFIKIDTEGYEYEVLLGSVKTLLRYKPGFIQIEMNWHALFRNNPLLKISTQLSAYRCFQILPFGDVLYEVDPRNPIRNFCQLSNFLFIHEDVNPQDF
jgi:FkbM family methyltransferase